MSGNGYRPDELDSGVSELQEIRAAERLSEQIDRLLAGQPVDLTDPRLAMAEQLSRLGDVLPSVDPTFEHRVLAPLRPRVRRRLSVPVPTFAARALSLTAAVVIVMALMLSLPGQTALARLAAIFHLESVDVGVNVATATPAVARRIVTPRIEHSLDGLEMARQVAPVPILAPQELPATWSLRGVTAVYYPDLPANIPLNIILTYESTTGSSLEIIEYFIQLGDNLTVDSLSRVDETSTAVREVMIDGRRAILIETDRTEDAYTLIWQQSGVLLEIEGYGVNSENLFAIAASIRSVE